MSWLREHVRLLSEEFNSNKDDRHDVHTKAFKRNLHWMIFVWTVCLTCLMVCGIFASLQSEVSGTSTIIRAITRGKEVNLFQRFYEIATLCFSRQENESVQILSEITSSTQLESANSLISNDNDEYDVCPIILSTVYRPTPHWIWTIASLYKGYNNVTTNLTFSEPTVLWRRGSAFDRIEDPIYKKLVTELLNKKLIRPVLATSNKYMPFENKFRHVVFSQKWQENMHFAKQSFDHVTAMEDCVSRNCRHCLILEDDIVLSWNWRKRLNEGLSHKNTTWGVLKLFELDDFIRVASPIEGWQIEDFPVLFGAPMILGLILYMLFRITVIQQIPGELSKSQKSFLLSVFYVYALAVIAALGHDFFTRDAFAAMQDYKWHTTMFRRSIHPTRGAVANMYKLEDIFDLVQSIKDLIWYSIDEARIMPRELRRIENARNFLSHFSFSNDCLRIDVIVAKYFMNLKRPVLILEPNVVQHIGFISTEPLNKNPFTAMTSTFEDGSIF
jgi:hypothetical protein